MRDIKYFLQKNFRLILIGLAVFGIIFVALYSSYKQIDQNTAEEVIGKKLNSDNFNVTDRLVDRDGWKLMEIRTSDSNDNAAFAIFHYEDNQLVLKLGPGTSFSRYNLKEAGVPENIQQEILSKLGQG